MYSDYDNLYVFYELLYLLDLSNDLIYIICIENKYTHARTCVYNINYHIVWCVKYRKKVLKPEIANRLYELLKAIGNEKGFTVVDCKIGESDHIHCFVAT